MESIVEKEMGLKRAARFRLSTVKEIAVVCSEQALDLGNGLFGFQTILISSIHGVILPQGKLAGGS